MNDWGMELALVCWTCGKEHKGIPVDKPYKCECGGYVVSPSQRAVKIRVYYTSETEQYKS